MTVLIAFAIALCCSLLLIPLASRWATRLGMVDHPTHRKVHDRPIPRTGGWGIVAGAIAPVALWHYFDPLVASFMAGVVVLFAFGLWDDARNLNHRIKFAGQIAAAVLVVYLGDLWVSHFPFIAATPLPEYIGRPFTVFALVGVMNAVNHSDGLDGLAGGESVLSLGAILALLVAAVGSNDPAALIACTALGSTLGFLRYNRHPAQVFMGDTGSQFLGFTIGVLVVYLTQVADSKLAATSALLLIGLPVFDLITTLALRIRGRMSWFAGSRNHIHHRLLDRGFSHAGTVTILCLFQAALVAGGYFLRVQPDWILMSCYLAICGSLLAFLVVTERRGWRYAGGIGYHRVAMAEPPQHLSNHARSERQGPI